MVSKRRRQKVYQCIPVINDEVRERELMRVEEERRDAECQSCRPEVDQVRDPKRQRHIQQHDQRAHSEVDTRTSETRVEREELHARSRETTASRDVPCATVGEISQDGMTIDLRRKDFEDRRERQEVLREAEDGLWSTTLGQF